MGSQSFTFTSRPKDTNSDTDSDGDGVTTIPGGGAQDDPSSDDEGGDDEGTRGEVADVAVPIGLIANLSVSNGKTSTRRNHDEDDDDLVSFRDLLSVCGN